MKVGDTVKANRDGVHHRKGDIFVITSISDCGGYLRFNGNLAGTARYCFELVDTVALLYDDLCGPTIPDAYFVAKEIFG